MFADKLTWAWPCVFVSRVRTHVYVALAVGAVGLIAVALRSIHLHARTAQIYGPEVTFDLSPMHQQVSYFAFFLWGGGVRGCVVAFRKW